VLLRVFIGFATASFALLLTPLFFAQQQSGFVGVAIFQVDRAFVGALLQAPQAQCQGVADRSCCEVIGTALKGASVAAY
jgi:hypothetical protein